MQHNDHPVLNDKLDRKEQVLMIANHIANCETPMVYGLHGDWGAGKTSFLRQLRYVLDGSEDGCNDSSNLSRRYKKIFTVWFDAWRYQQEKVPIVALLQEIRKRFHNSRKLFEEAKKISHVSVMSTLNSIDDIGKIIGLESLPISAKNIQKTGENWEKEHLEKRLGVDTVQEFLEKAVDTLLSEFVNVRQNDKKLVIFIDDLDRSAPHSAFRLLEALKIYLNIKKCVFVIGMNQALVVDSIAQCMPCEYSPSESNDKKSFFNLRAEAYLEKICSTIYRLIPPADPIQTILVWLDDEIQSDFMIAMKKYKRCLPPNPRKLKSLANLINNWRKKVLNTGEEFDISDIVKIKALTVIAYLYQFHSPLFQRLQYTPSFYTYMQKWLKGDLNINEMPSYFKVLSPATVMRGTGPYDATPIYEITSNFPDPYAPNVFWISEIIQDGDMREKDISNVLSIVVC